jgi:hypothetical protein
LPKSTRREFLTAGALFVGGAVGLELLAGRYSEIHGVDNFIYSLHVTLEEGLEMLGVWVFIRALVRYIHATHPAVGHTFAAVEPPAIDAPTKTESL